MAVDTMLLLAGLIFLSGSVGEPSTTAHSDDTSQSTAASGYAEIRFRTAGEDRVVSLSLQDANLREVLHTLAEIGCVGIVIDPEVDGIVTAELSGVPWDQAFHVILKAHGLAAEVEGEVWSGDGLGGCRSEKRVPKAQPATANGKPPAP